MIVIVDYDIGNLGAVANMLRKLGAGCEITSNSESIERASHIILPGNGSFDACIKSFRATGLVPLIEHRVREERIPLLGICVGAQMLGTESEEGVEAGLGWIDMSVKRFPAKAEYKLPHMGWNKVTCVRDDHILCRDMAPDARFYFLHSYYMAPKNTNDVLLASEHGIRFASAVAREGMIGVQFHPEKSHRFGKQLLANFIGLKRC